MHIWRFVTYAVHTSLSVTYCGLYLTAAFIWYVTSVCLWQNVTTWSFQPTAIKFGFFSNVDLVTIPCCYFFQMWLRSRQLVTITYVWQNVTAGCFLSAAIKFGFFSTNVTLNVTIGHNHLCVTKCHAWVFPARCY